MIRSNEWPHKIATQPRAKTSPHPNDNPLLRVNNHYHTFGRISRMLRNRHIFCCRFLRRRTFCPNSQESRPRSPKTRKNPQRRPPLRHWSRRRTLSPFCRKRPRSNSHRIRNRPICLRTRPLQTNHPRVERENGQKRFSQTFPQGRRHRHLLHAPLNLKKIPIKIRRRTPKRLQSNLI